MAEKAPSAAPQAPAGPTEEQLREVMVRVDQLRQQLAALENQRELIMELGTEARRAHAALEHLTTAKPGDDSLVPIGAGAFVHATLKDPSKAITNLGAGVHAELAVTDARDRMNARVESLDQAMTQLNGDITRVANDLERMNAMLEQVYGG